MPFPEEEPEETTDGRTDKTGCASGKIELRMQKKGRNENESRIYRLREHGNRHGKWNS